jgi:hypothetical protein
MPLTWTDFANGESALSIRNKLNTFNNATVTEVATVTSASNANNTAIATNTSDIATNATNIATNTSDIAALDTRVGAVETTLSDYNIYCTLFGVYSTPKAYNLTTSYQDLALFANSADNGFTVSATTGTLTPAHTGYHRISLFLTGTTTESSEKVATVALVEDGVVLMEGSTNYIDDTGINVSFTGIFPLTAGKVYKIQIKGNTNGSINITADNFSVDHVGD